MPACHAKDVLERDIEELETRMEKIDRKFRDFKDEVRDVIENEVDRVIGKKVEERIKKAFGNDLEELFEVLQDRLTHLEVEVEKVESHQKEDRAWWQQNWNDDYFTILNRIWHGRENKRSNGSHIHGLPDRGIYGSSGYDPMYAPHPYGQLR